MIDDETEARTSCTVLLIDNDGSQSAGCSLIDNETEVKAALARFADRLGGGSQSAMARFADQEEVSFLYCDRPRIVHYRCCQHIAYRQLSYFRTAQAGDAAEQ
jgi:hypothetical protein